jgi:photosystem II stability/assembly factor-like uncharacterized protein
MNRARVGFAVRLLAVVIAPSMLTPTTGAAAGDGDVVGTWVPAVGNLEGLESECGNVSELSIRPDRDELIVGVARAGLWRSDDGGATWNPLGQGEGSAVVTHRLSTVVYDPENPERFWIAGTYNAPFALVTDDGGTTFRALADVIQGEMLDVDMTDPERRTLVIGIHESARLSKSTDGGATWVPLEENLPANAGISSAAVVIDSQTYLYGTQPEPGAETTIGSGIFRTTDGGVTWTAVLDQGVIGRPHRDADGSMFWMLSGGRGMAASTDAGATWTVTPTTAISPSADNFVVLPDGRFAAISDHHVITSADHGASWRTVDAPLPYDPNGLAYSPFRNRFYIWRFECETGANPVLADSIMQLEFIPAA